MAKKRPQWLIDKYRKLGIEIPVSFQKLRSDWHGERDDYSCDECGKENVMTMEWGDNFFCYRCYIKGWDTQYWFDEETSNPHELWEQFEKELKDINNG